MRDVLQSTTNKQLPNPVSNHETQVVKDYKKIQVAITNGFNQSDLQFSKLYTCLSTAINEYDQLSQSLSSKSIRPTFLETVLQSCQKDKETCQLMLIHYPGFPKTNNLRINGPIHEPRVHFVQENIPPAPPTDTTQILLKTLRNEQDLMDKAGFIALTDLLNHKDLCHLTKNSITQSCLDDRIELLHINNSTYVRATYGHHTKLPDYFRQPLPLKRLPKTLVYATQWSELADIRKTGLSDPNTGYVIVSDKNHTYLDKPQHEAFIHINTKKLLKSGIEVSYASNDTYLIKGIIPEKHLRKITDKHAVAVKFSDAICTITQDNTPTINKLSPKIHSQLIQTVKYYTRHSDLVNDDATLNINILYKLLRDNFKQKHILNALTDKNFQILPTSQGHFVRSKYGHSVSCPKYELPKIQEYQKTPILIHGTTDTGLDAIKRFGIQIMTKTHIKLFSPNTKSLKNETNYTKYVYLNTKELLDANIPIFQASEDIYLVPTQIPPTLLTAVTDLNTYKTPRRVCVTTRAQAKHQTDTPSNLLKHRPAKKFHMANPAAEIHSHTNLLLENMQLTPDKIKQYQQLDTYIQSYITYIKDATLPRNYKTATRILNTSSHYLLQDGILYHKSLDKVHGHTIQIVTPASLTSHVLQFYHTSPSKGAHLGYIKTLRSIQCDFYWHKMAAEVKEYVMACQTCKKAKPSTVNSRFPLQERHPEATSFNQIYVTDVCELPRGDQNYKYIVSFVDAYSKFQIVVPLRKATAQTIAEAILKHVIYKFGHIIALNSDNGSIYCSKMFKDVTSQLGIKHIFGSTFRPSSQSLAERGYRVTNQVLRSYCNEQQTNWPKFLDAIVLAINCAPNYSGLSPYFVAMARQPCIKPLIQLPHIRENNRYFPTLEQMIANHQLIAKIIDTETGKYKQAMKRQYDKTAHAKPFTVGEIVYLKVEHFQSNDPAEMKKLMNRYTGPYVILKFNAPTAVVLRRITDNTILTKSVNTARLIRGGLFQPHPDTITEEQS
jgi:RNA:NAD 2'-phosphotransferase (TPT1/KptA family)/transposase InsO family protein